MPLDRYPHPIIAREGWPFIAIALVIAIGLSLTTWWLLAAIAWVAFVFVLQFFRDPPRNVPAQPNAVLAPADGRIVRIGPARDPYVNRDALMISVFMNVFNVHSNRSPVDATVADAWYHPGKFVNASFEKASSDNERNALRLVTDNGTEIVCVQIAGLIARRILCYVKRGDKLARGERYGFIRFGTETVVAELR